MGGLLQRAGSWLVSHDSVYYRLGDAGFRWLTNLAEGLFFIGAAGAVVAGLVLGVLLAAFLHVCHKSDSPLVL